MCVCVCVCVCLSPFSVCALFFLTGGRLVEERRLQKSSMDRSHSSDRPEATDGDGADERDGYETRSVGPRRKEAEVAGVVPRSSSARTARGADHPADAPRTPVARVSGQEEDDADADDGNDLLLLALRRDIEAEEADVDERGEPRETILTPETAQPRKRVHRRLWTPDASSSSGVNGGGSGGSGGGGGGGGTSDSFARRFPASKEEKLRRAQREEDKALRDRHARLHPVRAMPDEYGYHVSFYVVCDKTWQDYPKGARDDLANYRGTAVTAIATVTTLCSDTTAKRLSKQERVYLNPAAIPPQFVTRADSDSDTEVESDTEPSSDDDDDDTRQEQQQQEQQKKEQHADGKSACEIEDANQRSESAARRAKRRTKRATERRARRATECERRGKWELLTSYGWLREFAALMDAAAGIFTFHAEEQYGLLRKYWPSEQRQMLWRLRTLDVYGVAKKKQGAWTGPRLRDVLEMNEIRLRPNMMAAADALRRCDYYGVVASARLHVEAMHALFVHLCGRYASSHNLTCSLTVPIVMRAKKGRDGEVAVMARPVVPRMTLNLTAQWRKTCAPRDLNDTHTCSSPAATRRLVAAASPKPEQQQPPHPRQRLRESSPPPDPDVNAAPPTSPTPSRSARPPTALTSSSSPSSSSHLSSASSSFRPPVLSGPRRASDTAATATARGDRRVSAR